jgi:hypothetical protein
LVPAGMERDWNGYYDIRAEESAAVLGGSDCRRRETVADERNDANGSGRKEMKLQSRFELLRWAHLVIVFSLVGLLGIVLAGLFVVVPLLQWLFHDIPYALPKWNHVGRMTLGVLFIAFVAGTVARYYEKRQSGR